MGDHLIVMHSAVRYCPGYSRHEAPSILMEGSSIARDSEHGRAVTAQLTRRHDTLEDALDAANFALAAADVTRAVRRQARAACEDYFYRRLDLAPDLVLTDLPPVLDSLEPLPDDIRRALEDVVELVVDGDYDELRQLSRERLEIEDLRRRVEDDVPEALVLPSREAYGVEAITPFDEPDTPGWAYFLDLWTEEGPARLHIEGEIEEGPDGLLVTLTDVLP